MAKAKFLITMAFFLRFRCQSSESSYHTAARNHVRRSARSHPHPPTISSLQIIQSILATLQRKKLPPAYGFINGVRTEESPETLDVLRAWRTAGQPLANHTWSHPDFNDTTASQFIANIEANQPLLRTLMPAPSDDWHWLRYPYLNEGDTLEKHRAVRT